MNRLIKVLLTLVAVAGVFFAGWWAALATFGSREIEANAVEQTVAEAREGSVGRVFNFAVVVAIPIESVAVNELSGVVTQMGSTEAGNGSLLYMVGDTAVVAVRSPRPFYRDLSMGTKGDDVRALQQMLVEQGLFTGEPDGVFGSVTEGALKRFQTSLGAASDGFASLGSLVAIADLPMDVSYLDGFRVGQSLMGGEEIVYAPVGDREFFISLSESQREFIPLGATVDFTYGDQKFSAVVAEIRQPASLDGSLQAILSAPDGGLVCDTRCDLLPGVASSSLIAQIRPEPPIEGIVVPAAAVVTRPDGKAAVLMADGTQREVMVLGSGQGMVVVEGVVAGEVVVLGVSSSNEPGSDSRENPSQSGADSSRDSGD